MRALWSEKANPRPKSERESYDPSYGKGTERAALALSVLMRTSPQRRVCQTLARATAQRRGARHAPGERGGRARERRASKNGRQPIRQSFFT